MIRAVIFDMDDTLIDWAERHEDWEQLGQRFMQPVHDYLHQQGHNLPPLPELMAVWVDKIRGAWGATSAPEWYAPRTQDVMVAMLAELNLNISSINIDEMIGKYGWTLAPGVKLFDDTLEVLDTLCASGLKVGLMTNAAQPMWMRDRELHELGLLKYFDVRITAGDVGRIKPHPAPFNAAMQHLDVQPYEAIYVGDRLFYDVGGAQAAGMRGVWVRRMAAPENNVIKPNATIESLAALLDILDIWYPGWQENGQR